MLEREQQVFVPEAAGLDVGGDLSGEGLVDSDVPQLPAFGVGLHVEGLAVRLVACGEADDGAGESEHTGGAVEVPHAQFGQLAPAYAGLDRAFDEQARRPCGEGLEERVEFGRGDQADRPGGDGISLDPVAGVGSDELVVDGGGEPAVRR
ncbi:hypothetical protein [Glycomyces niveus]|uniref:Uncharacterized protein n=1 Tax=Glycomyces niveus TaxID=2820287 RepID=A0ABS3U242_9ACTN|nr:hypothetical protein [Glycomyces sp. NEAU-S30]MBO3731732.1 hypothetical protein [Glycomyces sp. NEAU-S30]